MKVNRVIIALLGLALSMPLSLRAELKLPAIFSDNMVLQQQMTVPVWGWSSPGAEVTVTFGNQTRSVSADAIASKS